jgi:hypothetical protein
MVPHLPAFQPWRTRLGSWTGWRFGVGCVALALLGCQSPGGEGMRTEPWLKDEVRLSRNQGQRVHYRAERGQFLTFTIQSKHLASKQGASKHLASKQGAGKEGTLRGRIPLSGAELSIDPQALDHSRGELTFDLEGLSLEAIDPAAREGAAFTEDPLLTRAARAWLTLGSELSQKERDGARRARFGMRLGRQLSSHSVQGGQAMAPAAADPAGATAVRRVSGIAQGDLLLLGREVTRELVVEVDFLASSGEGAKDAPASIVVRLSQAEAVPLLEHGIQPRDERGALLAEQVAALGRRSTLRALVSGQLSFVRTVDSVR